MDSCTRIGFLPVSVFVLALFIPATAFSQDDGLTISTDRPGFGDGTSVVQKEHLQLEGGLSVNHEQTSDTLSFPELLVRYGLTDSLEIRALPPIVDVEQFRSDNSDTDPTPFGLGAKLGTSLTEKLDLAGIANVTVPIRSKQDPAVSLAGALSHSTESWLGLTLWGGVEGTDHSGDPGANLFSSISANLTITDRLGSFAEFYWLIPEGQTETHIDGGLTYLITDRFQVDVHAGFEVPHEEDTYFVGAGIGWLL